MTNLVEITVKVNDDASKQLAAITSKFKTAGTSAGQGFSSSFSKSTGTGLLGSLLTGKGGSSVQSTAQQQGQNVGLGLARGMMQKFSTTMGSGLLSGLMGTSGSNKLFAGAGASVVQSAQAQGSSIAQGLAKGLDSGMQSTQSKLSGMLGGLFGGSGGGEGAAESAGAAAGGSYSKGFLGSVASMLGHISMPKTSSSNSGGGTSSSLAKGVAGGALPGIAGVGGIAASVAGIGGSILGAVPAVGALAAGLAVLGGGFAILDKDNKTFATSVTASFTAMGNTIAKAAAPLVGPLMDAFKQLASFVKSIGPELGNIFGAAVPLIQPLLKGVESLVSGLLPGLLTIIKAAGPAFDALASVLGSLGKDIGGMLSGFAPVIAASSTIFKALADVLSALFPIIGKLADEMAGALAPIFTTFAGIIKALLPVLGTIGNVLASFAKAVLTDLVGVFQTVGSLITDLAPSLKILGTTLGQVFNVLENSGVFAILANAISNVVPILANFINQVVKALAPALPPLIGALGMVAGILAGALGNALSVVLTAITPIVVIVAKLIAGFVNFLNNTHLLVPVVLALTVAWLALNTALLANPFVAIGVAIAVLAGLIVKYHTQIWDTIQTTWGNVEKFVEQVWNDLQIAVLTWVTVNLTALRDIVSAFTDFVSTIVTGAAKAFGWVPGVGGLLKTAAANVSAWRASANSDFDSVISSTQAYINKIKGIPASWTTKVTAEIAGEGNISFTDKVAQSISSGNFALGVSLARGGLLPGFGGGDIIPALLEPGETVVDKNTSKGLAGVFAAAGVPGYSTGGLAGIDPWISGNVSNWAQSELSTSIAAQIAAMKSKVTAAAQAAAATAAKVAASISSGGASLLHPTGSGSSVQALMQSMAASIGWTGAQWTDLYNVEMHEAGFNLTATNPSSGAYGLAQFINGPSEYAQYGGNSTTAAGQITAMFNYIKQRYGTPAGAWQHELDYGWYDKGGWLPTGKSIAINNTGAPERVIGPGGINVSLEVGGSGNSDFDSFMLNWLRGNVRIKGGGSVQAAFGRN